MKPTLFLALLFSLFTLSYAQTCDPGQRLFDHDLLQGEPVCIPENPERIVTDSLDTLGLMLTLGIVPAGHNHEFIDGLLTRNPELEPIGETFNAESVDIGLPANPESVLAAKPDLILVEASDVRAQLEAVAPVVAWDTYTNMEAAGKFSWSDPMMFWAEVLEVSEDAEAQRDLVNERLATLATLVEDKTVSIVSTNFLSGELLVGSPMYVYEQLARQAGLSRPAGQGADLGTHKAAYGTSHWGTVSPERLNEIDADVLIMLTYRATPEAEEGLKALLARLNGNPLWQTLGAVKNGAVYEVNSTQWLSFDFASVHSIIDQMFELVAGVDPQEVSPNPFLTEETSN